MTIPLPRTINKASAYNEKNHSQADGNVGQKLPGMDQASFREVHAGFLVSIFFFHYPLSSIHYFYAASSLQHTDKKEEDFVSLKEGEVRMYTCGPTVYGRPHIGNYSSFLLADLLRRWLEVSGYAVTHVKNITDVGHLAGDNIADAEGDDKIDRTPMPVWE